MVAVSKPTQTVKQTVNTVNSDGYTETNKRYGDYKYQDYANKKDYKIYKKDGKTFYYNEKAKQYIDMDAPTMTSAEQDKKDYEEAVKQGFKGQSIYKTKETSKLAKGKQDKFSADSKNKNRGLTIETQKSQQKEQVLPAKLSDRIELDTSDLTKEEKKKYAKDLIRQEKNRDKDSSYVRQGGAGIQGALGELRHTTKNVDENFVEPIARAPEAYDYGKLAQQQSMEYYKAMMGKKNNLAEINKKLEKYTKFNKDIIDSENELDSYFKNLPNQISGMKAGIENAGVLGAAGGIVGGGLGAIATRTPQGALAAAQTGAKLLGGAGYVKGQAENTFKLEAGATYQTLLDMGVPEDIAKKEAMRAGTENALIESGESLVDLLTLGKGSIAIDKLKDGLIKRYGVDFVKNLGKSYAANIVSEGLEEGTQEQRSIAAEKRAAQQTGIERDNSQDVNRILQSAKSGAIAAGISGGATRTLGMTGGSAMKTVSNAAMTRVQNLNPVEREALTEVTQKIKRGEQLDEQDMGVIGAINSKPIETVEETQPLQETKLPHSSRINEVGYHASNQTFNDYDTSKIGTGQGDNTQGKGINLASVKEAVDGVYGKNTYETNINLENAYTVDDKKLLSTFEKDFGYKTDMDNISDELQKKGYDGIVINVNGNKLYTVFDKNNLEIINNKNVKSNSKLTSDEINELKVLKDLPFEDEASDKRIDELLTKQDESLKNQMSPVRDLNEVRNYEEMGSKKINAYQYDNPEVKPYFEAVADNMLKELDNATRGEKFVTEDGTWKGQQRVISDDLAELLDGENGTKYSYEDIRKGLKAIIEDDGAENKAVSKRIEFYIDQRLREGYKDYLGYDVPRNTKYLDTLRNKMYESTIEKENVEDKSNMVYNKDTSKRYVTVAPYFNTPITKENFDDVKNAVDSDFKSKANDIASLLGINVSNVDTNIGGFTFQEGETAGQMVKELSYTFELENATNEQADILACLMGDLGHEQQEAVISSNYIDANSQNADALEFGIKFNNLNGVEEALEKAGIDDYTIDTSNNNIKILEFDLDNPQQAIDKIENLIVELGGNYNGKDQSKIESRYLDRDARRKTYEAWLANGENSNQNRQLRNYITEALQKLQGSEKDTKQELDSSFSNENIPAEKEETVLKFKNPQEEKQYFKDAGYDEKVAEVLTSNRKQKSSVKEAANEIAGEIYRKLIAKGGELERIAEITGKQQVKHKFDRSLRAESEANRHLSEAQADYNLKPYTNFKDADGNETSMSFDDIRKAVKKDKIPEKDFNTYLLHKLNEYRYPQGKPVFGDSITDDISREEIAKLEEKYENIEHHAENVWTFEQNQLKNDYEAGLITENVYKNLAKNEHYIRMQREVPSKGKMGLSVDKKGNITVNSPIQTAKGGNQDIKPVMENIAQNTIDRVKLARTNQSIKELAKAVGVGSKDSEISAITDEESFGINPDLVKKNEDGTYTITYFDKGLATTLPVNKAIYEAYSRNKYIDAIRNHPLYKVAFYAPKKVNRLFKNVVTTYSPTFLVKNAARDIGDAPVNSKHTREFLKIYGTGQSQKDILTGGPYTELYKAAGGVQDSYFYNGTFADQKSKVSKVGKKILSPLETANEIVETVPRLTEFMATFKANGYEVTEDGIVPMKGKNPTKTPEEVLDEALYNSAEITVNFKRKGDITAFLDESGATFLSASVAGFDKQVRNFKNAFSSGDKKQIVKLLTKAAMFGIAPTLINDALHGDEEEYKDLPEYQKDNYYLLRGKGWYQLPNKDVYIRIPKGRAMSVIGSAYRRTKDYASGKKDAYNGFLKFAADQVAPNSVFSNNIASPYFAVKNNKAWSGNEIVPSYMQRKKNKWKEYNSGTDEFSKWLGKKINKSPMKINYLIDQYTGGVGDLVLPNITPKVRNKKDLLHNPVTNPFIDAFSTNAVYSNKNQGEFYDMKDITGEDYEDLESNIDGARYNYLSSKGKEMAALNAEINEIQSSNLSNNEKYEKVTELKRQINKIAKDALRDAKNAKQVGENEFVVGGTHYMMQNGQMKSIDPEKLQQAEDLGLSISVWSDISSYKGKAKADKDENGESIYGTAKQKVVNYVYSKEELTDIQKKQILEQLYPKR